MKSIRKIAIAGNYTLRNRGDELLLKGTIALLTRIFGNIAHFVLFVTDPEEDKRRFNDDELISATFLPHPLETEKAKGTNAKIAALARFGCLFLWSCIYRSKPSQGLLKLLPRREKTKVAAIIDCDLVIYRSIDQLSNIFGAFTFLKLYFQVLFFYNLVGKRLLLHAQTVYLEGNSGLTRFLRYLLKHLSLRVKLTVRDTYSLKWLDANGIKHYGLIPPPSLAITEQIVRQTPGSESLKLLMIPRASLRGHQLKEGYGMLTKRLLSEYDNLDVYFMGQSSVAEFQDDDYKQIEAILTTLDERTKSRVHVIETNDKNLTEILKVISEAYCVISERAFSIVSALSLRVPAITLDPYGGKNIGLAQLFDFDRYSLASGSMDVDRVMSYVNEIFTNHDTIVTTLDLKVKGLARQAEEGTESLIFELDKDNSIADAKSTNAESTQFAESGKVSVIMVNYNGATFLKNGLTEAIHSFLKTDYPNFEFIFVDNCSTDNSVEEAQNVFSEYPKVPTLVMKNNNNAGFAGGCEAGIKLATGEYICLVNNDDKAIDREWLSHLIKVIKSDERIAVTFCKKLRWDSPTEVDARGLTMNPAGLMQNTHLEDELSDCLVWQTPVLIKRRIIREIGGLFDEDYVVLNDDTDSSLRIWMAGYRIVYVPSAVVLHKRSATMKMLPVEFITFHGRKNTIQTVIKNYGSMNLIKWLPITAGIYFTLYLYYLKIGRKDHARATLKALTWNIRNFGRLLKKRRQVQRNVRKIDDRSLFKLMNRFNMMEIIKGDKVWPK